MFHAPGSLFGFFCGVLFLLALLGLGAEIKGMTRALRVSGYAVYFWVLAGIITFLLFVAVPPAHAQGNEGDWRPNADPDQLALYVGGVQVGAHDYSTDKYVPIVGRDAAGKAQWGQPTEPPVRPPHRPVTNFGVDAGKVREFAKFGAGGQVYSHEGRIVSREQAMRLMTPAIEQDGKLPDDGRLPRLTLIGPTADCQRVCADMATNPILAAYKGQVLVQTYQPSDVMVARVVPPAVLAAGLPCIYLQRPDGRVLWREAGYPGPDALATALRRTRPDYDPSRDPGPGGTLGVANVPPEFVGLGIFVVLAATVCYYARPRPATRPTTAIWSR